MENLLKQLIDGQTTLFNEIKTLNRNQESFGSELQVLKQNQESFKATQENIIERLDNIEGRQHEHSDIMKAILHNQEVSNAKLEALALNTISMAALENLATKEDTAKINAKLELINSRLFAQEAEIVNLKLVK